MADDIVLTVRVRDQARGEFQRLDRQLDRMRRSLRNVGSASSGTSQQFQRMGQQLGDVQTRMQRLASAGQTTGRELTHMRSSLQLLNRELGVAQRSGAITRDEYTRLRGQLDRTRLTFDGLNQQVRLHGTSLQRTTNDAERARLAQDRLRLAWARSEQNAVRLRQNEDRLRLAQQKLSQSTRSVTSDSQFMGGTFDRFRQKAIGTAVVLGASLLPTIGALAPMIAGLGSIAGVAALAFMGLDKPTKFLTKDQKDFLKAIKPVTAEFARLQETARQAVLPKFVKSAGDLRKMVSGLNPVLKIAGDSFGDLVGKIARGVSSKDFMGPFTENVKMGTKWVEEFLASFGKFSIAFFEFGTKSKPALDAWQNLLGGFMDRGLPSMFKNMEQGIKGSSEFLNGLSFLINDSILPTLGKMTASFMEAFGPLLKEMLIGAGTAFNTFGDVFEDVMEGFEPLANLAADALRAWNDVVKIGIEVAGSLVKNLGGAFIQTFLDLAGIDISNFGEGFRGLSEWVNANEGRIREFFAGMAKGIISFTAAAVEKVPVVIEAFAQLTNAGLLMADGIVSSLAFALGDIPVIGDKFKDANTKFDEFAAGVRTGLGEAATKAREFSDAFQPNALRATLKIDVDTAQANLDSIKEQLKDPTLTDEQVATLTVMKEQAEKDLASAKGKLEAFDGKKATGKVTVSGIAAALGGIGSVGGALAGLNGRTASTRVTNYVSTVNEGTFYKGEPLMKPRGATGGMFTGKKFRYATGGPVVGPGTGTSDDVFAPWLSNGEFVIKAASVQKYGESFLQRLNDGAIEMPRMAKGGKVSKQAKAEAEARNRARPDLTISHFGRMAGFKNNEFIGDTTRANAIIDLVNALNQWRSTILKATHGGLERGLLKKLDSAGRSLLKWEKKLNTVEKSLDKAKTALTDLKTKASQMRESVRSNVLSSNNITQLASGDKPVTLSAIMQTMRQDRDKATAFSQALSGLKAKGLDKGIIQDIAEAGIDGGGLQTAGALLQASGSEIASINNFRSQIAKSATSAGNTAADAFYGAGIKAAEGLVKGLEKQKKSIEAAMMKIAKSMEKALKKALGIKSPSKVTEKIGEFTAEGFAVGMEKNRRAAHAWDSMINIRPTGGTGGRMDANVGPQIIQLVVGGRVLDEIILDSNRRTVRTRGGNAQAVFGRP